MKITSIVVAAATMMSLGAPSIHAQTSAADDSLLVVSLHQGASYFKQMVTGSADRMPAEDYSFRPAPAVRSFAELVGHVADANYTFCSLMKGEKRSEPSIEKTKTTKAELQRALEESFKYCEPALLAMNGPRGREMVPFRGSSHPARVVMNFRTYHGLLHYGNVITYMRLRGKVPPSTEP